MKKLNRVVAVSMISGGLAFACAGVASAHGSDAHGKAVHSPGVVSGNLVQAPVHVPVNVVGDTANVIGVLNPAFGDLGTSD